MRVLFDGFWWVRGPVSNGHVMRELILAWEKEFPQDEMIVAVPEADLDAARVQLPSRVRIVRTRLRPQGISAILELPVIASWVRADRVVAHNFTPLWGRRAVFVHDLIFMTSPEWFTRLERTYFGLMPLLIRRAGWIFTSTGTEAERIRRLVRPRQHVVPIGLGLSRSLDRADAVRPPSCADLSGFLLSVGRLNARKNLGAAISGALLSGRATPSHPLLVVGEPGGRPAELPDEASSAVRSGAVRLLGFVSDDELAWLYSNAAVFLFLSRDEGFGMPTLEALRFGAPIVASDIPVFREILGASARFADPSDVDAIAGCIEEAMAAPRPMPRASDDLDYSWTKSARTMRSTLVRGGGR